MSRYGWQIHITRAEHWSESDRNPTVADEWLALVETDPELVIDPRDNGLYFALWLRAGYRSFACCSTAAQLPIAPWIRSLSVWLG